ncbi:hypothetical protein KIPB_010077, partial [Kipferlia bialata]
DVGSRVARVCLRDRLRALQTRIDESAADPLSNLMGVEQTQGTEAQSQKERETSLLLNTVRSYSRQAMSLMASASSVAPVRHSPHSKEMVQAVADLIGSLSRLLVAHVRRMPSVPDVNTSQALVQCMLRCCKGVCDSVTTDSATLLTSCQIPLDCAITEHWTELLGLDSEPVAQDGLNYTFMYIY